MPTRRDAHDQALFEYLRGRAFEHDGHRVRLKYTHYSFKKSAFGDPRQIREHRNVRVGVLTAQEDIEMGKLVGDHPSDWVHLAIDGEFATYLDVTCEIDPL